MSLADPLKARPAEPRARPAGRRPTAARDAFAPHAGRATDLIGAMPPPPFSGASEGRA